MVKKTATKILILKKNIYSNTRILEELLKGKRDIIKLII